MTLAKTIVGCVLLTFTLGCGGAAEPTPTAPAASEPTASLSPDTPRSVTPDEPLPPATSPYEALPANVRTLLDTPFTGDFDAMVKRRLIRAGVVYNRTLYFIDKGTQRGLTYESVRLFEEEVNKRLNTGVLRVHVAIVPLTRDQLFPALEAGKVDVVAAQLTVTPEREKVAAFSTPTRTGVSEVVVTAPDAAPVTTADDLSGREVFVRASSSYHESIRAVNESLVRRNLPPVIIRNAPEPLEDDDILEMVNAGLIDITVVDDFVAEFWSEVFTDMRISRAATLRENGTIAVGVRKNNPRVLQAVNMWVKEYGPRTAFGNTMERRYLQNTAYVRNAASDSERRKLAELVAFFKTYASKYEVDYLLMAAQGYQESRLDHAARSRVGAIGVMQIMPATGKDLRVGDITQLEPNIHGGVKYFRFMMDEFFKDEPMDDLNKGLMTFASYNAGPGRIRQLRRETAQRGLNPNVWFGNVERIVSERIGRETVQYVSNIYKYYVAYRLVMERDLARIKAIDAVKP